MKANTIALILVVVVVLVGVAVVVSKVGGTLIIPDYRTPAQRAGDVLVDWFAERI